MPNWSKYQLAVFDNVANGTGHTVVNAVAGSGKTTTIVEALGHVPPGCKTLFVAFNKSIAENLKKQAPRGVEVSTLHSYGLRVITRSIGRLQIDANKVDGKLREMYPDDAAVERVYGEDFPGTAFELRRDIAKTVSLAKGQLASDESEIEAIADTFGIESAQEGEQFTKDVLDVLTWCTGAAEDGRIDFDDMIWLPLVLNLHQTQFDRVFVDEVQDLNKAQIEMTMRAVRGNGRICAVGDPRQAIYGFRGADSAAVDNVVSRLQAKVLPLSVCYRCCRSVIRKAQEVVPTIEWSDHAQEGEVHTATKHEMRRDARAGDFVLSRTNAPLISLCLRFLKEGRPASIQGRDIGASLTAFVKRSKSNTVAELRNYVETWRDSEVKRLTEKRRNTQAVEDKAACILALSEDAVTVSDVIESIESLFSDKDEKARIVLSTTHKAKGLERDRVWLLTSTYRRRPEVEEDNLYYVAVTRAKKTLFMVES